MHSYSAQTIPLAYFLRFHKIGHANGKGKPLHMCVTYIHMLYTHFNKSPYEGTHARQITHIASQETPLLLTPLFFPPCLSLLHSVLLHTPPYTRISYIPEMTSSDMWPLPQGGETMREGERKEGVQERWVG